MSKVGFGACVGKKSRLQNASKVAVGACVPCALVVVLVVVVVVVVVVAVVAEVVVVVVVVLRL